MTWDIRLDSKAYKWLNACGSFQCVAPTKKGLRCSITIDAYDQRQASILIGEIRDLPDGADRDTRIRAYILQSCCRKWHRDLLWNDEETGCLDDLIGNYAEYLDMVLVSVPIAPDGKILRSGKVVDSSATLKQYGQRPGYFVPYSSGPHDSIRDDIRESVNNLKDKRGHVYSFYWPSHPGYVKIGFTSRHVEDRMIEWEDCHPGALWSKAGYVAYPERMERLIHLQMAEHRRKIISCKYCLKGHIEWFELPIATVDRIVEDWIEVARREPLYGSDGYLTAAWVRRIYNFKGTITARALLDILDAEEALKQIAIALEKKREELAMMKQKVIKTVTALEQSKIELLSVQAVQKLVETTGVAPARLPPSPQPSLFAPPKAQTPAQSIVSAPRSTAHEDEILTFFADFMSLLARAEVVTPAPFTSTLRETRRMLRPIPRVAVA